MRKYHYIVFTIILFNLTVFWGCEKKERTLTVTIDESINHKAQWVYWFSLYGNEYNVIDSCYIEQGQAEFVLKDSIMNDSIKHTEIIFSEIVLPWEYASFIIDSDDRDIRISNLTSDGLYQNGCIITGALAENEDRKRFLQQKYFNEKIAYLIDQMIMKIDPKRLDDLTLESGLEGLLHYILAHIQGVQTQSEILPFDSDYLKDVYNVVNKVDKKGINKRLHMLINKYIAFYQGRELKYTMDIKPFLRKRKISEKKLLNTPLNIKNGLSGVLLNNILT